ncbi:MAG: family 20 glycosylhydrolase [Bacteroidales bacterium]|nr:family 20 glycosylhydrolase [Bacteroidales bacterium]
MGHDVVMTPNTYCYLDLKQGDPELEPPYGYSQLLLSTAYSYDPIPKGLTEGEAKHVLGVQGNLWGESIQNETDMDYMLFPRLLAVAEVGWTSKNNREWDDFTDRLEYNLLRLKNLGIAYAPSMYNVSVEGVWDKNENGIIVSMKTEQGRVPLHFTQDGSEPSLQSELYSKPFVLKETTVLKAATFEKEKQIGRVTTKKYNIHKAAGITIETEKIWSDRFPADVSLLTDCTRGSNDFKDSKWLAIERNDFQAIIDLGREMPVTKVELGYLERQRQFIFPPELVDVWLSTDGKNYTKTGSERTDVSLENTEPVIRTVEISFPSTKARYVKVFAKNTGICPSGHKWAGRNAWLFLDEIFVE